MINDLIYSSEIEQILDHQHIVIEVSVVLLTILVVVIVIAYLAWRERKNQTEER